MSDVAKHRPKKQPAASVRPPPPPKKMARGLEDDSPNEGQLTFTHQFTPMSGAHGGERTEASHSGQGLFVAQSWEASSAHARRLGTRLVPLAMVILQ
jgi:hypothetical protein